MQLLIADDHVLFREGLSLAVTQFFTAYEIHQVDNWKKVHQAFNNYHFNLAILDIGMPAQQDWQKELNQLIVNNPKAIICIMSASSEKEDVQLALENGAKGYICKTANMQETINALLKIAQGESYFPTELLQKTRYINTTAGARLTLRQREVLKLMIEGKSNKVIAQELNLTENTVKRHIYNIYQLLNVNNRAEAVALIVKKDLLNIY